MLKPPVVIFLTGKIISLVVEKIKRGFGGFKKASW